jgi:hypothetical protein
MEEDKREQSCLPHGGWMQKKAESEPEIVGLLPSSTFVPSGILSYWTLQATSKEVFSFSCHPT